MAWYNNNNNEIKPFFFYFHSFFDSLTVCLCCSCCCLVILSQAIAAGQTALRLALLPATERTSARGTRDLCQAGETQHTIPHTHAHQKKKNPFSFIYCLFTMIWQIWYRSVSSSLFYVGRPSLVCVNIT